MRNSPLVVCQRAEDSRANLLAGMGMTLRQVLAVEAVSAVVSAGERRLGSPLHGRLPLVVQPPRRETRWGPFRRSYASPAQ